MGNLGPVKIRGSSIETPWAPGKRLNGEDVAGVEDQEGGLTKKFEIDPNAFQNPVGDQSSNWNTAMGSFLKDTTGVAPQATYGQLGATALSQGQNMGPTATYGGARLNADQYNSTFGQEQQLANQLGMQAQGQGPSVAQVTAQQQYQQNLASQMAMLGSQRGSSNPALAQQAALQAGANAQQQAAQQAVLGRTQEALGAQANQGNLLGSMNQQAQGFTTADAGLQQQAALQSMGAINSQNAAQAQLGQQNQQFNSGNINSQNLEQAKLNSQTQMANLQAALQQGQINASQYDQYMGILQQNISAQMNANAAAQQLATNYDLGNRNLDAGLAAQTNAQNMQIASTAAQTLGTVAALAASATSDKRVKKNIQLASKEMNSFLNSLLF